MKHNFTLRQMLSAFFMFLLMGAVVTSCGDDNDGFGIGSGNGNNTTGETSNGEIGGSTSDETGTDDEEESFDDALVWEFFAISEGGRGAMAVCEYSGSSYNDRNRWPGKVIIPSTVTLSEYGREYSVTGIAENAFRDCRYITAIKIPETVTSIGYEAFAYCSSLTSISIPKDVTSIRDDTFYGCSSLTSISIPENVMSIGNRAFAYCSSLTSVSLPESVTSIESYAFSECSKLTSIICRAENVPIIERWGIPYTLGNMSNVTLYVPASAVEKYMASGSWNGSKFKAILPIEE